MKLRQQPMETQIRPSLAPIDFASDRNACSELIRNAAAIKNVVQEAEGYLLLAPYAVFERQTSDTEQSAELLQLAKDATMAAKQLGGLQPDHTRLLAAELKTVEHMLMKQTIDEAVWDDDMDPVVKAMALKLEKTKISSILTRPTSGR
jgi:hypothetical protein